MEWIALILLIFALLLILGKVVNTFPRNYPYQQRGPLLTRAERSFYGVLCQAINQRALIFAKVRIADVLCTEKGLSTKRRMTAFNRISAKHFDFILCQPETLQVIAAIELDDASHNSPKVQARDRLVEGACYAAGLTLHRIKARSTYSIKDLREQLFPSPAPETVHCAEPASSISVKAKALSRPSNPTTQAPLKLAATTKKTLCPKCSAELVKRIAKKGKHQGTIFMACSSYPKCRFIAKNHSSAVTDASTAVR